MLTIMPRLAMTALTLMSPCSLHCTAQSPDAPPLLCTQHPFGTALHPCMLLLLAAHTHTIITPPPRLSC